MKWAKGQSGNPNGRPPAPERDKLRQALAFEGKRLNKDFWVHVAEQAFKDNTILKEIVKKFVPDMKEVQLDLSGNQLVQSVLSALPPDIAEGVRKAIEAKLQCSPKKSNP